MRVGLVLPSTRSFLPYVANFERAIRSAGLGDTEAISWDRLRTEAPDRLVYVDGKAAHRRGALDHFRYATFVREALNERNYDRVIIFSIPLAVFLNKLLVRQYKKRFILDVRDYHALLGVFDLTSVVRSACFTTISSPAYTTWLPPGGEYVLSHNMNYQVAPSPRCAKPVASDDRLVFSCIGALKDFQVNKRLIDVIRGRDRLEARFCGHGVINEQLRSYVRRKHVSNVSLTGRYRKDEEPQLYREASAINMLMSTGSRNNATCLSNRLYNALIHARPLVAVKGSYLSDVISKYHLGEVVPSVECVPSCLEELETKFDWIAFSEGREAFLDAVAVDEDKFASKIEEFLAARP